MRTSWRDYGLLTAAATIAAAWVLVLVAVLLSGVEAASRATFSQTAIMATALISSLLCWWRARRSAGRRRRAWVLLGAAGVSGLTGNVVAALTGGDDLGDLALVCALLIGIAALLSFPEQPVQRSQLVRMLLDGVVVGGSVLFVSALVVFPAMTVDDGVFHLGRLLALALPVLDAVVTTLAVLLIMRSTGADRVPLALVGLSFTMYAVADLAFAVVDSTGGFQFGTIADLGWVIGYALGGVAACHPAGSGIAADTVAAREPADEREGSPVAGTVVTFGLFTAAAVVQIRESTQEISGLAVALWFLVLTAVAARQIWLVVANERLRRGLEQRVAERTADLAALNRTTQLTLESVGDGIYGVDRDGVITFINAAGARTLGVHPAALTGAHAHDDLHQRGEPGDGGAPLYPYEGCYIHQAISRGVTITGQEDAYRRADGLTVPVEVTASPLVDDGDVTGAVVVFRDVTQRREIDRMKDEFISVISHELRTPLTSIKGSIGLVAGESTGPVSPQAKRLLSIAGESVDRLARLINDILEVERLESGVDPLHLTDVDVRDAVRTAVEQTETLADQAGVAVTVGEVPGTVRADVDRIVQTLVNLLGNAVKFTPPGGRVDITARTTGTFVEVSVTDTGRGVPDDKREQIFTRFEQVDSSDAREKGGTGLGLAISRSIVGRHGGRIWVEPAVGDRPGSTFRFTLPLA